MSPEFNNQPRLGLEKRIKTSIISSKPRRHCSLSRAKPFRILSIRCWSLRRAPVISLVPGCLVNMQLFTSPRLISFSQAGYFVDGPHVSICAFSRVLPATIATTSGPTRELDVETFEGANMSLVPVASESEFLAPGEEKNGPDGTSFHKYCDGKYTNSGSYRMSTLDLLQPRRRQRPSAAAQIEERGMRDGCESPRRHVFFEITIIHLLKHLSLPTGFVVALAHLHWHPFTIKKRAATIENEHVCSFSTVPVAARLPPPPPFHCRKRAHLLVFDGHGCSSATFTTLSRLGGRQQPAAANTYEMEDGVTAMTAASAANADGGSPTPSAAITTSGICNEEVSTLRCAFLHFFLTQQGGTTSLLTLCSRNRACVLDFEGGVLFSTTTTNRPCRLHVNH